MPLGTLDYRHFSRQNRELVAELVRIRSDWRRALDLLGRISRRQQHSKVRQLLRSERYRLLHAYRGVLKAKHIRDATRTSLETLSELIDPFSPTGERVYSKVIRQDGRDRIVETFGPIKRGRQHMVADVIRALHPPRANQFLFNGGIPAALAAVEAACARGLTHAVELDVKSFYRNIPRVCLAGILRPLPEAVVDHVVWDLSLRVNDDDMTGIIPSRRTSPPLNDTHGLSLGSASSPIVGEVMIGRLLVANEIDFGPDIITYADNLLVLGRSEQEAEARAEDLKALASLPAYGSLRLREQGRGHWLQPGQSPGGHFASGVPFAGQFGQRNNEGDFDWEPSPDRQMRHWIARGDTCPSISEIKRAQARLAASHRAYPRWRDGMISEAEERARLSSAMYMQVPTPETLAAAGRDLVLALMLMRDHDVQIDELIPVFHEMQEIRRERLKDECAALLRRILPEPRAEQAA